MVKRESNQAGTQKVKLDLMEKSKNLVEWLNLMVSEPYYLFHFLAFFSYFVLRSSASLILSPSISHRLLHREIQAILALAVFAVIKMVKDETWEACIADTLFFAKLLLVAVSLILDYHLALCCIYLNTAACLPRTRYFKQINTAAIRNLVDRREYIKILVEFHALCSSACIRASRCFPELSIVYSNKNLSFGMVDLGLFPNAAEKFGISLSGGMSQLPTYILFENAAEITRFPEWDFEAKSSHPPVSKRLLYKHFELDRHLLEYINNK